MRLLVYPFAMTLSVTVPLLAAASPRPGQPVLVFASPFDAPAALLELIGRADGSILRGTAFPWLGVAVSDKAGFAERLRQGGAWLVLDASGIAGCVGSTRVERE